MSSTAEPASTRPVTATGLLNRAYEDLTPEVRNRHKLSDSSTELEIQPYASFTEVRQKTVRQGFVGRGALDAGDIPASGYTSPPPPPLYVAVSSAAQLQVRPSVAVYADANKPPADDTSIRQVAQSAMNSDPRLDPDAIYGKVNKVSKNAASAPRADERDSSKTSAGDSESQYVLPDPPLDNS